MDSGSSCAASSTVCSSPSAAVYPLSPAVNSRHLQCPMCQKRFTKPVRLCCGHAFCKGCADTWLRNCTTCAVCRAPTLDPVRSNSLEELLTQANKRPGERSIFSRVVSEPFRRTFTGGPVREVKQMQKESARASLRRKKSVKFDSKTGKQYQSTENKENTGDGNNPQLRRTSMVRRSIRRIKNLF